MKNFKILWLVVTLMVSLFFVSGKYVDFYRFKVTGALFELLWLPFLIMLLLIPAYSLYMVIRKETTGKTWFVISLVVSLATIGWMVWAG